MDPSLLFPETHLQPLPSDSSSKKVTPHPQGKSFASAVANSVCDIPLSQLPIPCLKGDRLAITIPEDEYKLGVDACKHHLHGRVVWSKGAPPLTVVNLKNKLMQLWPSIGKWGVTSLGKGFFEFSFSSLEDVQRVRSVNAWSIPQGVLKLFPWTKDFVPSTLKQTSAQVWIRIHGLSQEYWRPRILFAIASSIGTPICIDSASNMSAFDRPFGHFVRVLVDLDLTKDLSHKILVERVGFAFFVDIEYEKIPEFCSYCSCIGHSVANCKKKEMNQGKGKVYLAKTDKASNVSAGKTPPMDEGKSQKDKSQGPEQNTNDEVNEEDLNSDPVLLEVIKENAIVPVSQNNIEQSNSDVHIDVTQMIDLVPETQVNQLENNMVKEFLQNSWDNMADGISDEELGSDCIPEKEFQQILFWNIRGIANKASRLALKNLIQNNHPNLVCIAGPWMDFEKFPQRWLHRLDFKDFAFNKRDNLLPNLWCFCKSNLNPNVLEIDDQHISFTLNVSNNIMGFSVVYASTSYVIRRNLWNALKQTPTGVPWCYIGDFNAIISAEEHKGRCAPAKVPMADFFNWSNNLNLIHLPTTGNQFSWNNGRKGLCLTEKRLDRSICNMDLLNNCNLVVCNTLTKIRSDHFPIMLTCDFEKVHYSSQFRFLKMWTSSMECLQVVKDSWSTNLVGCPMFILDKKLKILKNNLKVWNRNNFGDVKVKVKNAEAHLQNIQMEIANSGYTDDLKEKETKAQYDMEAALNIEEEFWKEKARIKWQSDGDRNTKFFHTYANIKRKTNLISSLRINDSIVTDKNSLENHIVEHFQNLFNNNAVLQEDSSLHNVIPNMISDQTNALLTMVPTEDEIKHSVFSLKADSAPGPDGFGGSFYHHYWDIIKGDVTNAVSQFFLHGWIPKGYNANSIVLIPKSKDAETLSDYRPIALANFKFKIITKILADRLASLLPSLISFEQKGFIKGRNIRDGICLTSEAINLLNNKSFSGNIALKIDITKAFDSISWKFILKTLNSFGFSSIFCNWISIILHSATLSINFNGKLTGYFSCSNGVRQGDPLSPLLFCLAQEVLSRNITSLVSSNQFNRIQATRNCFVDSHTMYADDIMIFCRGDQKSLSNISNLLNTYAEHSGQFCSKHKSLIYAGGMSSSRHKILADIIGFKMAYPPLLYLGAPIFIGKPKASHFLFLADKIKLKLAAWKGSMLTMAGRVQLVKAVIHSMLIHCMTVYYWPSSIIKLIDKWIRNSIWSGNMDKKKLVTVKWKTCCTGYKEGGLGLKSIKIFNDATCLTLGWSFLQNQHSWASVLAARVRRKNRFINYSIKSSIWSSIKGNLSMITDNCQWLIGDGSNINFWLDNWYGEPLVDVFKIPSVFHQSLQVKVKDWFTNGSWVIPGNVLTAFPELINITSKISSTAEKDTLIWRAAEDGMLTVKLAYDSILKPHHSQKWLSFPWHRDIPPSQSMVVWRLIHKKMPSDDNLKIRGLSFPSMCSLCKSSEESAFHIFFDCTYAKKLWKCLAVKLQFHSFHNFEDCLNWIQRSWSNQAKVVSFAIIINMIHHIWKARNSARFEDTQISFERCCSNVTTAVRLIGNSSTNCSNSDMDSFLLLKSFDINIRPRKPSCTVEVIWCPPPLGWVKCNIDGLAKGSPMLSSCGGIFRNHNADHLGSFCEFLGDGNSVSAELCAAMLAIEKACVFNWKKLWLETDCTVVVQAFSNPNLVPWKIKARWLKCRAYTLEMDFMITHIYREANFCANFMANLGLLYMNFTWFSSLHYGLVSNFLLDKEGTPRVRFCI
ncbi:uncharacterized protein LOC131657925 [Vicia villosa]|uniref:uncharacterized protein LOC131657925 n=1 Tax=Vicia villosa TaxID=3911 RepID=UPI00273C5E97|nr:uncharacterized protein LOC131657925 [Vicia villosa]